MKNLYYMLLIGNPVHLWASSWYSAFFWNEYVPWWLLTRTRRWYFLSVCEMEKPGNARSAAAVNFPHCEAVPQLIKPVESFSLGWETGNGWNEVLINYKGLFLRCLRKIGVCHHSYILNFHVYVSNMKLKSTIF